MSAHRRYKLRDFAFAQMLVTSRKRASLTQEEIALRIGVSEKSIRNWEAGSNYPSEPNLQKLIELYLHKNVFVPGYEQEEARVLWDKLRESTSHRTTSFNEQWFEALLTQWHVQLPEGSQTPAQPVSPEQHLSETSLAIDPAKGSNSFHPPFRLLLGDWSEALDVSAWYGRTEELAELERWLLTDCCRLVAVLGMGGIGKTALVTKLVQQVAPRFDCVLWRSLYNAPPLKDVLRDWLQILAEPYRMSLPQEVDQSLTLFIELLQKRRCLLVLDNLETLFQEGILEGHYREGYEGYAMLIRYVAETTHQSCLLMTSRELFTDLGIFTGRQAPVRVLRPGGLTVLACQQLLQDKGLFGDQEAWDDLVQRYAGNPLALKIVAETVRELFGGDIVAFLAEDFLTFHGIRQLLTQQFERLSALEQELMYWLAIERELTSLETLRADLRYPIAKSEMIEVMYSLRNRSLMERGEHGAVFTLQPVVLEYVTERLVALVSGELRESRPVLLLSHALLQAQAKDYLRSSQAQFLLQPVLDQLRSQFGTISDLEAHLERLLQQLRALPRVAQGYGGGNVVNLLVRLNGHVKGKDCSQLTIWQADLQGVEAHDANFATSDLTGSVLTETMDSIRSVAFSANGQYLAGGTNNGQIRVWRASDGQPLLALQAHTRMVWALAFHPESTLLVSGGYDGLVKVWEVSSGQCVSTLRGHTKWVQCVAFHPAGRLLAACGDDGSIRLWDLQAGCCLKIWHEQHGDGWAVAFSPDGRLLAGSYGGGRIKLWDHVSGQCLWSAAAHHGSDVPSLAFSPDGELLVSGGADATIMVWQASTGKHLSTLHGHTNEVRSLTFNAEGLLASGSFDRTVKLWHIGREEGAGQYVDTLQEHTGLVSSTAFGPDDRLLSGSQDGTVKLWQIGKAGEGGKCLRTLRGYSRLVNAVAFSPDGQLLVSDESNGTIRIWETKGGQCLRVFLKQASEYSTVAFSPDGRLFAQSSPDKTIKLWEVESGRCLTTLQGHQREIWSVAFSSDGRFLVSGSLDRTVKLWEVESGRCLATLQGHQNWIWSVACSPDGLLLASGDLDGVAKLWEVGSGQCLHTLQGSPKAILALTFTSDGSRLLSSNVQDLVTVWDVQSGDRLRTMPGIGESYWLHSMAFSADGSLLATAGTDQTVKLWKVSSGELLRKFPCGTGQPWPVAFSADQRLLASGTDEGTILLWERHTGKCLMTLRSDRPYERMNITGVTGITEAQKGSLITLGAIDEEESMSLENMTRCIYQPEELMTPVQVYRTLGIARQSVYDRLHKGKLTPIYLHGDLRFLRSEIEAWKVQRERRGRDPKHE